MKAPFWHRQVKKLLDKAIALALLILTGPLLLLIALALYFHFGSPVLFRQERSGLGGKVFNIIKFRTMRNGRDARGRLLPDHERLTAFGIFLRQSSLDELPQLLNVLRGDMSLVGPRPLPPAFATRYTGAQAERLNVPPGITGWAQVNGRNSLTWEEKFALDVEYVHRWSLALDARILLRTVPVVFGCAGIVNPGHTTSANFRGAKPSGEET